MDEVFLNTTPMRICLDASRFRKTINIGAWCFHNGEGCELIKSNVLPYHWDDKSKAARDFHYLTDLRRRLIPVLAKEMNAIHASDYSDRAWHLMLGYWLTQFLAVVFDRWSMLQVAESGGDPLVSYVLDEDWHQYVPKDTVQAGEQFVDDHWNHVFIGQLLEQYSNVQLERVPTALTKSKGDALNEVSNSNVFRLNRVIKKILKTGFKYFIRNIGFGRRVYVLSSTSLSMRNIFRLILRLPGVVWHDPDFPVIEDYTYDKAMRNWTLSGQHDSHFEEIVKELIPFWMPSVFIEGFSKMHDLIEAMTLPSQPDVIFTTSKHFSDDAFKCWAATKIDSGSQLVLGQHGGGPFHRYNGGGQFELDLADIEVTTGSGNKSYSHLRDVGQFWARLDYGKWNPLGPALVVTVAMPRYSSDLRSMPLAGQMLNYFEDQFSFYGSLSHRVQTNTIIRLQKSVPDYKWKISERWLSRFPSVQLDEGEIPIKKLVHGVRLFISTYNATTYNESLAANIPTVIYWDKKYWECSDWAEVDFDALKSVGIFHETPESAARHVEAIWDDVSQWWSAPMLQAVREQFCRKYAYRHPSVITKLAGVLREAAGT